MAVLPVRREIVAGALRLLPGSSVYGGELHPVREGQLCRWEAFVSDPKRQRLQLQGDAVENYSERRQSDGTPQLLQRPGVWQGEDVAARGGTGCDFHERLRHARDPAAQHRAGDSQDGGRPQKAAPVCRSEVHGRARQEVQRQEADVFPGAARQVRLRQYGHAYQLSVRRRTGAAPCGQRVPIIIIPYCISLFLGGRCLCCFYSRQC